jgi:hypothetical protein
MERQMHLNEDIIRHLTTRVDELEEGPSAVLRAKERGDDRGRRSGRGENGYDTRPSFDKGPGKDAKAGPDDSKPKDAKAPDAKDDKAGDKPAPETKSSQPDDAGPKDEKAAKAGGGDA